MTTILLALVLFNVNIPDAEQIVGAPQGIALQGLALEQRTNQVAAGIRCPVCQGLSVADSPSEMAVNMKAQVKALLARGYTEKQILQYFEKSYGQFVLLKPKFEGVNTLVWLIPAFALVIGVALVFAKIRKLSASSPSPSTTNHQPPTTDSPDDPYLSRVRELLSEAKQ